MWLFGLPGDNAGNKLNINEFKEIFLELYPGLCIYASNYVNDINISKDIVQDVLTRFWIENDKLTNKNLVKPYLFKAVKHRALNHKKREKRQTGLDEIFNHQNVSHDFIDHHDAISSLSLKNLRTDLENAISELPEQRQLIFRMSRFENMKHKEIAAKLNISTKTVETQIYRSLLHLHDKLRHYLNDR